MKLCIVGITGLVGSELINVLNESALKIDDFIPAASEKSKGKSISLRGRNYTTVTPAEACDMKPDIAIFSAGSAVSKEWAPRFAEKGCFVIDNSSQWRMYNDVPLVVPEINADTISSETKIISNPNCSTIQMVLALSRLHLAFGIKRIVVSTYQSVSGTGVAAVKQLMNERDGIDGEKVYPYPIDMNCLPHGGSFLSNGYTTEEEKLVNETRKILRAPQIQVSATVVRVPVTGGHSESVNIEFEKPYEIADIYKLLNETPGVVVQDNPAENIYPMPLYAKGKNETFVGRIRRDDSIANGLNLWVVADNLRKGAATNAVQIAEWVGGKVM
ncbi:MAG: aspartate-semialdehyde dehydrogenase [Bacteroidetes bacterium HGW-Bacteroidetes-6]|jgi:aspartate-semialdehyde dehydrogenase|nr:MAG: aspartate-semialdehyde dehydrogenase [Bacteroidetes bacterium HGW-Bacteroidetes-6]